MVVWTRLKLVINGLQKDFVRMPLPDLSASRKEAAPILDALRTAFGFGIVIEGQRSLDELKKWK